LLLVAGVQPSAASSRPVSASVRAHSRKRASDGVVSMAAAPAGVGFSERDYIATRMTFG
jgi:hypothetical protein